MILICESPLTKSAWYRAWIGRGWLGRRAGLTPAPHVPRFK